MPARDFYHDTVRNALAKDGWTITHDPLTLRWGRKDLFVDLGAEKLLAAEKEGRRIAVEIKSFLGHSEVEDLKNALGQYILYRDIMSELETERDRELYLAVHRAVYADVFEEPFGRLLIDKGHLKLLVFDEHKEEIFRWIP
jgi:XisH protein